MCPFWPQKTGDSKARRVPPLLAALAVAAAAWACGTPAWAQFVTYQWNGTTSTSATTSTNWSSGSMPVFGGGTAATVNGRINVYNSSTANTLSYEPAQGWTVLAPSSGNRALVIGHGGVGAPNGSMTITGGTLTLSSGSAENIIGTSGANGTLTIDGGVFQSGTAALMLGFSTASGTATLTVKSGSANIPYVLNNVANTSTVNADGGVLVLGSATATSALAFNFNSGTVQALTSSTNFLGGAVTNVRDGGAILDTAGNAITLTQGLRHSTIVGDAATDGGLTKRGDGTLTLSGSSTYTGATTINGGTLQIGGNGSIYNGGTSAGSIVVNNGGTLLFGRNDTFGAAGSTPLVVVTVNAGGTMSSGSNFTTLLNPVFNGGSVVSNGGANASYPAFSFKGTVAVGGATATTFSVLSGSNNGIMVGPTDVNGSTTFDVADVTASAAADLTAGVPFWNANGRTSGITKGGAGTMVLTAANTYTGTTSVNAGTLQVGDSGTTGSLSSSSAITGSSGATLAFSRTDNYGGNFANVISGSLAVVLNSGTLMLTGSNTYTGTTQINAGTLQIGNNNAAGSLSGSTSITGAAGATLAYNRSDASSITSPIGGSLGLAVNSGTLWLSASNSYTGGTQLNGGVLSLTRAASLGAVATTGTISFSGGTLQYSGSNNTDYSSRFSTANNQAYSIDTNGRLVTFATPLSSTGGTLTKSGPGTLTVAGTNTYTGVTTVNGGVLQFTRPTALYNGGTASWTATNITVNNAGTVAVSVGSSGFSAANVTTLLANLGGLGGAVNNNGLRAGSAFGIDTTNAGGTFTLNDVVADSTGTGGGAIGLAKLGTGTLSLPADNSFTGNVTLYSSTAGSVVEVTRSTSLGTGTKTVTALGYGLGLALNGTDSDITLASAISYDLSNDGSTSGYNTPALRNVAGNNTIAGSITVNNGGAGLGVQSDAGSLTLAGNIIASSTAVGGLRSVFLGGAANGVVSGTMLSGVANLSVTKQGSGTWTLTAANTYTGTTSVNAGTLQIGNGGSTGALSPSSVITGSAGATLAFNRSDTLTQGTHFANGIGGGLGLQKLGIGKVTLTSSNSYTGTTSISAGVLEIGPAGSIGSTSGILISGSTAELKYNSAAALDRSINLVQGTISGTGTIGTAVTFASGDSLSPGNSPGTQAYANLLKWDPAGTYRWELNALTGTAGTNWDFVDVTSGTFDLSGLSTAPGNQFVLDLVTLTAGNVAGELTVPFDGGTYTLPIAGYSSSVGRFLLPTGFANTAGADLTGLFTINLANWQGTQPQVGDVSVRINSTATGLDLVIVPEPGAVALAGLGIAMAGWSLRRRRRIAS